MIRLAPLTKHNWKTCIALQLSDHQKDFLPENVYSIAEAQFYPDATARAIYYNDEMVGFVLYGRDDETHQWTIFRLMIDYRHQQKGYGTQALKKVIKNIRENQDSQSVFIRYHRHNTVACELYKRLGFEEVATNANDTVTAMLKLM